MTYRVLDLFSGIGGFSLGLERTGGFETVAFCEIDPFCRRVLAKHWPAVRCYEDVRELTAQKLAADGIGVDVICGGFPCQDISLAGKGAGLEGERSGLWSEIARLSGELRPRFVIVENVSALLGRGLGVVLGDLAEIGYDAEWHCIPASALGAPHRRDRLWLVAHPNGKRHERPRPAATHPYYQERDVPPSERGWGAVIHAALPSGSHVAYPDRAGQQERREPIVIRAEQPLVTCGGEGLADARGVGSQGRSYGHGHDGQTRLEWGSEFARSHGRSNGWWLAEPDVGRVAHGVPSRVDRLRALGNAVVPQIPEMIGRAILAAEAPLMEAAE
jgi:DNA (cytosine-5)-methyltransferase 1